MTKIDRTEDQQNRATEMFDSFRDELLKRDLSNTENYDKSILTLSAAALGLSLTAIRFVIPLDTANHLWLVILGWVLLLGCIMSSLGAFLVSNKAIEIQIHHAEQYYIDGVQEALDGKNVFLRLNDILNYATGLMFAVAITAIVAFVMLNITSGDKIMSKKSGDENTTLNVSNESANVPAMTKILSDADISINSANVPTMQQAPQTTTTSQSGGGNGNDSGSSSSGG